MRGAAALVMLAAMSAAHATPPDARTRCSAEAGWNEPAPPRRIHGNTWYVGTCGISAVLVTGDSGHVLVDAGTEAAAPLVEANVRALGFRVEDIRAIVGSHVHADHAGGLARLQRDSRAPVYARQPAIAALQAGRPGDDDPQARSGGEFPAVGRLTEVSDGATVGVGSVVLTAHATPGHTSGGTSWTWRSCERGACVDVAFVDSLTPVSDEGFRYSDEAAHPGLAAAFRGSISNVAALPCDVLVTTHPGASDLWSRIGPGATKPVVDPASCRALARRANLQLDERLAKEAATR